MKSTSGCADHSFQALVVISDVVSMAILEICLVLYDIVQISFSWLKFV